MESLDCRFYSLEEIRKITGKERARDIKSILDSLCYRYQWKNRQGVLITKRPEAPVEKITAFVRDVLHLNSQINPVEFALFLSLLLEDEEFASMPWEARAMMLYEKCNFSVSEKTLRNWAKALIKENYLIKDTLTRTVWCSQSNSGIKHQEWIENPDEHEEYQKYKAERKEMVENLEKTGMSFAEAYKNTLCALWKKYHKIYYYCATMIVDGIRLEELVELTNAALIDDIKKR